MTAPADAEVVAAAARPPVCTAQLGDIADITSGITKGRRTKEPVSEVPFLRAGNLGEGVLHLDEVKTIPATAREVERYRLLPGDVLMVEGSGSIARLGQGWLFEGQVESCIHQNHVFRARPDQSVVLPLYLAWYLQSPPARRYFISIGKTSHGLNTINKSQVSALPVPLPSLYEQRHVVELVAALWEDVGEGVRSLTSALEQAAPMRAALLEPCWNGFDTVALESLIAAPLKNGKSVQTAEDGCPVLRLTALRDGVVDTSEAKVGAWTEQLARPFLVKRDDFLVSRGNGSLKLVGRGGLVDTEPPIVAFPDTLIRVRPDARVLSGRFLRLVWNSPRVREQIERRAHTSAGIYKINQQMLRAVELPIPRLEDQERLVAKTERQMAAVTALETSLRAQLARADDLKRAMLQDVFTGQLVHS